MTGEGGKARWSRNEETATTVSSAVQKWGNASTSIAQPKSAVGPTRLVSIVVSKKGRREGGREAGFARPWTGAAAR